MVNSYEMTMVVRGRKRAMASDGELEFEMRVRLRVRLARWEQELALIGTRRWRIPQAGASQREEQAKF